MSFSNTGVTMVVHLSPVGTFNSLNLLTSLDVNRKLLDGFWFSVIVILSSNASSSNHFNRSSSRFNAQNCSITYESTGCLICGKQNKIVFKFNLLDLVNGGTRMWSLSIAFSFHFPLLLLCLMMKLSGFPSSTRVSIVNKNNSENLFSSSFEMISSFSISFCKFNPGTALDIRIGITWICACGSFLRDLEVGVMLNSNLPTQLNGIPDPITALDSKKLALSNPGSSGLFLM